MIKLDWWYVQPTVSIVHHKKDSIELHSGGSYCMLAVALWLMVIIMEKAFSNLFGVDCTITESVISVTHVCI